MSELSFNFLNSSTRRVKPRVKQSFLTFDFMERKLLSSTLLCGVVWCVFFFFQFYPVSNFEKFISLGLGTVRSEMIIM